MSKSKTIISSLIGFLGVITLLLTFLVMPNQKASVSAASDDAQSLDITLNNDLFSTSGNTRSFTYNLYGNGHNILDYFRYQTTGVYSDMGDDKNTETYFRHHKKTAAVAFGEDYGRGTITSEIKLTNALKVAGLNGFLTVKPDASWFGNSKSTYIQVQFLAGSTALYDTGRQTDIDDTHYLNCEPYNVNSDVYYLIFIAASSRYNLTNDVDARFITPSLTFTTTDITNPIIDSLTVQDENTFTMSKTVTLQLTDIESGIDRVEVNGSVASISYTDATQRNATATFLVDENDKLYNIKVYDNVGNVTEQNYTSSFIDNTAPEISIPNLDGVTSNYFSLSFDTSILSNAQSDETFYYTLDGTSPVDSETRKVLNSGANNLTFDTNGTYTMQVVGIDSAGNVSEIKTFIFTIDAYFYKIDNVLRGTSPTATNIDYLISFAYLANSRSF